MEFTSLALARLSRTLDCRENFQSDVGLFCMHSSCQPWRIDKAVLYIRPNQGVREMVYSDNVTPLSQFPLFIIYFFVYYFFVRFLIGKGK